MCQLHQGEHFIHVYIFILVCNMSTNLQYKQLSYIAVWCTTLVAIKKVYIKSKIMSVHQLKSTVQLLVLHASCVLGWRWLVQGICTWQCACCSNICKILNTSRYLVAFYRDLYVYIHCGPSTKVFATENRSSKCFYNV